MRPCSFWIFLSLILEVSGVTLRHGLAAGTGADLAGRIDFAAIVRIEVRESGGGVSGSGVLLNQEWVLSAGHLVQSAVAGNVMVEVNGVPRRVSAAHAHPGWLDSPSVGLSQRNDLVMLRLSEPVVAAPFVPIWSGGGSGSLIGLMAGFGNGGNGLLGAYLPADGLQAAMNLVDRSLLGGDGGFWVTDFDSGQSQYNSLNQSTVDLRYFDVDGGEPKLSETVFSSPGDVSLAGFSGLPTAEHFFPEAGEIFPEGTTARGDSGGPLFLFSDERARWELAGVTSFGVNPLYPTGFNRFDSRYGDLSFFADVSLQQDWLTSVMVPEPSSQMVWGGALLLVCWRKRR